MEDIAFASAKRLAALIRRKKIGAVELLDHYLARVDRHNPKLNAIIATDLAAARQRARGADRALARGQAWGPLHGVPMTIKECFDTVGMPTTWGLTELRDNRPTRNAVAVERWLAELRELADRGDDESLFRAVVKTVLESFRRDTVYHRLMMYASLEGHDMARIARSKYSGPILGFLRDYVARRQAQGAFKRMRPEWVVHVLLSTTTHYAQWAALGDNVLGLTDTEVARQAVALAVRLGAGS